MILKMLWEFICLYAHGFNKSKILFRFSASYLPYEMLFMMCAKLPSIGKVWYAKVLNLWSLHSYLSILTFTAFRLTLFFYYTDQHINCYSSTSRNENMTLLGCALKCHYSLLESSNRWLDDAQLIVCYTWFRYQWIWMISMDMNITLCKFSFQNSFPEWDIIERLYFMKFWVFWKFLVFM